MEFKKRILVMEGGVEDGKALVFKLMPTLHHMATVRFVIRIWKYASKRCEKWENYIEDRLNNLFNEIKKGVKKFVLPEKIKSQILFVVKGIYSEVESWLFFHSSLNEFFFQPWRYLRSIHWTSRGRVDYTRTAQLILSDNTLNPNLIEKLKSLYTISSIGDRSLECYRMWDYSFDNFTYRFFKFGRNQYSCLDLIDFLRNFLETPRGIFLRQKRKLPFALGFNPYDDYCMFLSEHSAQEQERLFSQNIVMFVYLMEDWLWRDYLMPAFYRFFKNIEHNLHDFMHALSECYLYGYFPEWHRYCLIEILETHLDRIDLSKLEECDTFFDFIFSLRFDERYHKLYRTLVTLISSESHCLTWYICCMDDYSKTFSVETMLEELIHSRFLYDLLPQQDIGTKFESAYRSLVSFLIFILFTHTDILLAENVCFFLPKDNKERFIEQLSRVDYFIERSYSCLCINYFETYTQILNFVFSHDQRKISEFKATKLINKSRLLDDSFLTSFRDSWLPWQNLRSAIEWCFQSGDDQERIEIFKRKLMSEGQLILVVNQLLQPCFKLADDFLKWLFSDATNQNDIIHLVKRDLFLCYQLQYSKIKELVQRKMCSGPQIISPEYYSALLRQPICDEATNVIRRNYQSFIQWVQPNYEVLKFFIEPL